MKRRNKIHVTVLIICALLLSINANPAIGSEDYILSLIVQTNGVTLPESVTCWGTKNPNMPLMSFFQTDDVDLNQPIPLTKVAIGNRVVCRVYLTDPYIGLHWSAKADWDGTECTMSGDDSHQWPDKQPTTRVILQAQGPNCP